MSRARVLVISHLFPLPRDPRGGCFVHEQVLALRQSQGIDARVLCPQPFPLSLRRPHTIPGSFLRYRSAFRDLCWQDCNGVPVFYVPWLTGRLSFWLWEATLRDSLQEILPTILSDFPFDLIHAHTANPDGYAALQVSQQLGIPFVITEHTSPFRMLTDHPRTRRQTLDSLRSASRVWCVSDSLQREVCDYFTPHECHHFNVIPNGVDCQLFQPPERWWPDSLRPRLLSIGFIEARKNPLGLVDAMAKIRTRIPQVRLTLVGDGPLESQVRRRIRKLNLTDTIRLVGFSNRAEVARLLREECDILVHASLAETFGVVLIEALASGKPVVATRCGGPESIITDPSLGVLCQPGDSEALAEAVLDTIHRLPTFDSMKIRQHAYRHYDYGQIAKRLAAEYDAVIGNGRSGTVRSHCA